MCWGCWWIQQEAHHGYLLLATCLSHGWLPSPYLRLFPVGMPLRDELLNGGTNSEGCHGCTKALPVSSSSVGYPSSVAWEPVFCLLIALVPCDGDKIQKALLNWKEGMFLILTSFTGRRPETCTQRTQSDASFQLPVHVATLGVRVRCSISA